MSKSRIFSAQTRRVDGAVAIDMHGEVDSFADAGMQAAYSEAEALNPPVIVLNFSDVDYINSTGIALIVSLLSKARKANRKVMVYGLSEHYVTIFQITRLAEFMSIFPDEAAALASVTAAGG